jgi:hypothetical protein
MFLRLNHAYPFLRLNHPYPAIICPLTIPNQSDVSVGGVARPLGYFNALKVIFTLPIVDGYSTTVVLATRSFPGT